MSTWPSSISNQLTQQSKSSGIGSSIPAQTPEYGLGSAIRDLEKEVSAACELSTNLTASLGIVENETACSNPKTLGHLGAVCDLLERLRFANYRLSAAIRHLNS